MIEYNAADDTEKCDFHPLDHFYKVGQLLKLKILPHGDINNSAVHSTIQVLIRKIVSRTCSVATVVEIEEEEKPCVRNGTVFLKLYDRRFFEGPREDLRLKPWTNSIEEEYITAVRNGSIIKVFDYELQDTDDELSEAYGEDEEKTNADGEASVKLTHYHMWKDEAAVYQRM